MKNLVAEMIFAVLLVSLFSGNLVSSLLYDHSATAECLPSPMKPQYGGGIIFNPEFNSGLEGWFSFAHAETEERVSATGNKYAITRNRSRSYQSVSQKVYLQKGKLHTFSAWLQTNGGTAPVVAIFRTGSSFVHVGSVVAKSGCWSLLKGGFSAQSSRPAELYFESNNTDVDILVDSVSLQPFSKKQWRHHQAANIDKLRKKTVRFQVVDSQGRPLLGSKISIHQTKNRFPFGCAVTSAILTNTRYQNWFGSRFSLTTFENEMKWYSTVTTTGQEDYTIPDKMLEWMHQNNILVRGHNVLWDDPNYQLGWVKSLPTEELRKATNERVNSVIQRYRGQVIHWDVVNENLHFSFFEDKLGSNASGTYYQMAHWLDPDTILFLNDYNTLEEPGDVKSTPAKYIEKLDEIRQLVGNGVQLGIGLESHFSKPNIPYMRAALDTLASANIPIWLTEVDVTNDPNQAEYLEEILREAYAHPAVQGIVIWGGWHADGCYRMCLTDNNFRNLPTGDVVDKMIQEMSSNSVSLVTDNDGYTETKLFHGDYEIKINHLSIQSPAFQNLTVHAGFEEESILQIDIHA